MLAPDQNRRASRVVRGSTFRRAIASLIVAFSVAACSDANDAPKLAQITLLAPSTSIVTGQTVLVTPRPLDQFGAAIAPGTIEWRSTATSIATVSTNGEITGVAPGTVAVSATSGGVTGQLQFTVVSASITSLTITPATLSLTQGQSVTASTSGLDQLGRPLASGTVTWSSASSAIATVDNAGVVRAIAPGTTNITAAVGTVTTQRTVTVIASPAIRITEVESSGGTPGDWIELFNPTTVAVDISRWGVKDNDNTRTFAFPTGTVIPAGAYFVVEEGTFGFGLGVADAARIFNQFGVVVDEYSWTAHALTTYGRCPSPTGAFVTNATSTKGTANDCRALIRVNEVESNGGTPGDWIELFNFGTTPVDLSNFLVKDNDDTRTTRLPAGAAIAPGGYYVIEESVLGFGLGAADAARIFDATSTLLDSYAWTSHAVITYGRCPDGVGEFADNSVATKGAANNCTPVAGPPTSPWPGSDDVQAVSGAAVFGGNLSGLTYEAASGGQPAVLWAARNGPGSVFRLILSGGIWTPDPSNGWGAGKLVRFPDGLGEPDAEGITIVAGASSGGLYVASERNNSANGVSRNSILRFDPSAAGSTLTATNEWNLTADLPVTGANLGVEAITWIPDSMLVANGFIDEPRARAYAPADYPNHGTGIFFVGVEANGVIYAYALNHVTNVATRVATIVTAFPGVMGMEYDRETGYLWATCDNGCGNTSGVLQIDVTVGSTTRGRFLAPRRFARPTTMPNLNNEGFAFAPQSTCVAGRKAVFWADDAETGGISIRSASIPCTTFSRAPATFRRSGGLEH